VALDIFEMIGISRMPRNETPLPSAEEDEIKRRLRLGIERSRALIAQYRARLAMLEIVPRDGRRDARRSARKALAPATPKKFMEN
jgi:hypothetical protein